MLDFEKCKEVVEEVWLRNGLVWDKADRDFYLGVVNTWEGMGITIEKMYERNCYLYPNLGELMFVADTEEGLDKAIWKHIRLPRADGDPKEIIDNVHLAALAAVEE